MKITDQDIVRTTRQLRDEHDAQLHVNPWHSRRFHIPAWIVAVPAAAIIGFVLGFWTQNHSQTSSPLTALVDTIYIKVREPNPLKDSLAQVMPAASTETTVAPKPSVRRAATPCSEHPSVGRPVADDRIRYDLLVRN